MQPNWQFTEPHPLGLVFHELRQVNWRRSGVPFRCWPSYRRTLAYVYALRGTAETVRAQLPLPVPLGRAAQLLERRRQVSLGHEGACSFLRSAPALGLGAEDVVVLEGLVITRQVDVLKSQWGYPVALPILADLLDVSQERLWRIVHGALGRWGLVEVKEEGGAAFARVPEAIVELFTTAASSCHVPDSPAE